jgi:NitT/TauT family transport system substrate-binding protein
MPLLTNAAAMRMIGAMIDLLQPHRRRLLAGLGLAIAIAMMVTTPGISPAAEPAKVRIGVLSFGTVGWALDVIRHHGLDRRHGVAIEVVTLANKDATAVALQGGAVDAIVTDWVWVSRQRHAGADYTFVPQSVAVGSLMVHPDSGIRTLADLKGRRIGIAGGPFDKSWLLLRAYGRKTLGLDLKEMAEPTFAAPPILNQIMLRGDIPAVLNFWNYSARLQAAGMKELIAVADLLPALGIDRPPPLIGWVFSEAWAAKNKAAVRGFLDSLGEATRMLATSDAEWNRLRPLTKAEDDHTFRALRDGYRAGIPASFGPADVAAARQLFGVLVNYGGPALVGKANTLAPGTFWNEYAF